MLLGFAAPARADEPVLADEIVVARDGGLTRSERARAGVTPERELPLAGVEVVATDGDRGDALRTLRADPDVEWAEPNHPRTIAAEPLAGLLWGLDNTGQSVWWQRGTPDADVDAPEAWSLGRGAGVVVAVVDTGIDPSHPDLAGRVVPGWDFVEGDAVPQDLSGHGTHVAGTIAAGQNGAGVIGVAPAASVMPLRVLDANGQGSSADVAAAFAYAAERGVRVVNASLGSAFPSHAEQQAIREHPGTLFVVASGNGGADGAGDDVDGGTGEYPCALPEPNVVCVGATDQHDALAPFSNFGATSVDLFAPGAAIVSAFPAARASHLDRYFGTGPGYEVMQGTSMASPARRRRGRDRGRPAARLGRHGAQGRAARRRGPGPRARRPRRHRRAPRRRRHRRPRRRPAAGAPDRSAFEPASAVAAGRRTGRAHARAARGRAPRPAPARARPSADLPRRDGLPRKDRDPLLLARRLRHGDHPARAAALPPARVRLGPHRPAHAPRRGGHDALDRRREPARHAAPAGALAGRRDRPGRHRAPRLHVGGR